MRRLARWRLIVAAALVLGAGSAWWAIESGESASVANGPWRSNPLVGTPAAGVYHRARVAVAGPLALNRSEAIYWTATEDSRGHALTRGRSYRLTGGNPDARWWSITAYDEEGFLIPNPAGRYSVNSANVTCSKEGRFEIRIGQPKQPQDWLPVDGSGPFYLTLRLYQPGPSVTADLRHARLPRIEPTEDGP